VSRGPSSPPFRLGNPLKNWGCRLIFLSLPYSLRLFSFSITFLSTLIFEFYSQTVPSFFFFFFPANGVLSSIVTILFFGCQFELLCFFSPFSVPFLLLMILFFSLPASLAPSPLTQALRSLSFRSLYSFFSPKSGLGMPSFPFFFVVIGEHSGFLVLSPFLSPRHEHSFSLFFFPP